MSFFISSIKFNNGKSYFLLAFAAFISHSVYSFEYHMLKVSMVFCVKFEETISMEIIIYELDDGVVVF